MDIGDPRAHYDYSAWAGQLRRIHMQLCADPNGSRTEILRLYAGAANISDLVLYANGSPLIDENDKLHDMLEQLFLELYRPE